MIIDLIDLLRDSFKERGERSGDEISFFCPRHESSKRKLNINLKTYKSHCWVCDIGSSSIFGLFKKLKFDTSILKDTKFYVEEIDEDEDDCDKRVVLPDYFSPLCYKVKSMYYSLAIEYLRKRNITDLEILRYKIGYCELGEHRGRVIFPSFDLEGKLNYFVGRWFLERKSFKYKNSSAKKSEIIFNELYVDFKKPVTICEGVFDSFVCGKNSVPLLGSTISEKLISRLVENKCPTVFIAIDPDTYHFDDEKNSKVVRISKKLISYRIEPMFIDIRPYKDAGEMPRKEFLARKEKAVVVDDDFLFKAKLGAIN
jgi:DNA primase